MSPKLVSVVTSPRWIAAIATVIGLVLSDFLGLNLDEKTIAGVVGTVASLIVGTSIRQPEKPEAKP